MVAITTAPARARATIDRVSPAFIVHERELTTRRATAIPLAKLDRQVSVELERMLKNDAPETDTMAKRILVIEDDDALARLYRSALCIAGFDVNVAGDGITALEDIDEDHPDLVVLDLHLPQLAGETILSEVAATPDTRDIPVIVVTGTDASPVARVTAVLRKPCDPGDLVALVQQHLN